MKLFLILSITIVLCLQVSHQSSNEDDCDCEKKQDNADSLVDGMKSLYPEDNLKKLFEDKMKKEPEFQKLGDLLASDDFQNLIKAMPDDPEMQELQKKMKARGMIR